MTDRDVIAWARSSAYSAHVLEAKRAQLAYMIARGVADELGAALALRNR